MVSNVGTFLQLTAGPWLMNELTGSPLMVSLVTTALTLPRLLLTIPSGALADAVDRRTLMMLGNGFSAVAAALMALLALSGSITPPLLLGLTFMLGVGSAITLPAQQTLIPDLVGASLRPQAITLNSAAFNVARAIGPSLGGLLVSVGLTGAAFGLNAASFVLVIGVLFRVPRQPVEEIRTSLFRSASMGLRYVRFTRPIRLLVIVTTLFMATAVSVQSLLPNVAADDLAVGATGFGVLYGLFGLGALVAIGFRDRVLRKLSARMLPGAILLFGLSGVTFGLAPGPVLAGVAITAAGAGWVWTLVTLNASIQTLAPKWVRSRVIAVYLLAIGIQPFGAALAGGIAEVIGPGNAVALLNVVTIAVAVWAFRVDLPVLDDIVEPTPTQRPPKPVHDAKVVGSPIIVATTWDVDPAELDPFMEAMRELRRVRLTSGAHRWSIYHDVEQPHLITESMVLTSWEEHLAQLGRLDDEAVAVIARARSFDRSGGPTTRHFAGLDLRGRDTTSAVDQLLGLHAELHSLRDSRRRT